MSSSQRLLSVLAAALAVLHVAHAQTGLKSIPTLAASDAELLKLGQLMRDADAEKPKYCEFYVDFQGHFDRGSNADAAPNPLFQNVKEGLYKKSSYAALLDLVPLFKPQTGEPEDMSAGKVAKMRHFIEVVFSSGPMQQLISLMRAKNHPFAANPNTFKQSLFNMWFGTFSRAKGKLDSSAFEHVFIGEIKNGEVSGMHNWVVINKLEQDTKNKLDYRGFIIKRADIIASANFLWNGLEKKTGSFLMGTSPAYDFALLTACFLARRGNTKCEVTIDDCPVSVQAYENVQNGNTFIGTVYPEPGPTSPACMANFKARSKNSGK